MEHNIVFLSNKTMRETGVLDMAEAMKDDERVYKMYHDDHLILPGKLVLRWGKTAADENVYGRINAMPGYVGDEYDMAGIKWIGSGPQNYKKGLPRASVTMILNDPDTKLPVCVLDGTEVSAMRTGASGGVAMKYLSRKDAETIAILGAGAQGRTQLDAALLARDLKKCMVFDIRKEASEKFVADMSAKYPNLKFTVCETAEEACRPADIIDSVTLADTPIIEGAWLKKGALVMNMADFECTYDCIERASKVVVDFWDSVKHRMISTVALMWRDGLFKDEDLHAEMGDIVAGEKPGRENDDEIIYFNAVGAGVLDIAVATRCYKKALEEGKGVTVPFWEE